jgi:hypothetical protein
LNSGNTYQSPVRTVSEDPAQRYAQKGPDSG